MRKTSECPDNILKPVEMLKTVVLNYSKLKYWLNSSLKIYIFDYVDVIYYISKMFYVNLENMKY